MFSILYVLIKDNSVHHVFNIIKKNKSKIKLVINNLAISCFIKSFHFFIDFRQQHKSLFKSIVYRMPRYCYLKFIAFSTFISAFLRVFVMTSAGLCMCRWNALPNTMQSILFLFYFYPKYVNFFSPQKYYRLLLDSFIV